MSGSDGEELTEARRCIQCCLSDRIPNVTINEQGICNHCSEYNEDADKVNLAAARKELDVTIADVKHQSGEYGTYDCIVALSGGKDSSYMLKLLVENYQLNVLAITVDNGFLSEQSVINSRIVCDQLGVDFFLFRPQFSVMKNMYRQNLASVPSRRSMIKRASDICGSCINLINTIMLREALTRNVGLIAGGYIAGQVPSGSSVYSLHLDTLKLFSSLDSKQGSEALKTEVLSKKYQIEAPLFERYSRSNSVKIVNPFLAYEYDEEHILSVLTKMGWQRPSDTGAHSSNCRINDVGIANHIKKYGFHPYEFELAEQVRKGKLDRNVAIQKIQSPLDKNRIAVIERSLK